MEKLRFNLEMILTFFFMTTCSSQRFQWHRWTLNFSLPYLLTATTNKPFLPKVLFNHDWDRVVGSFRNPYRNTNSKREQIYLLRHMSCMEFSQILMSFLKMAQIKSSCRSFLQNLGRILGRDGDLLSTHALKLWAQIKWWISTLWPNIWPMSSIFPSPLLLAQNSLLH